MITHLVLHQTIYLQNFLIFYVATEYILKDLEKKRIVLRFSLRVLIVVNYVIDWIGPRTVQRIGYLAI